MQNPVSSTASRRRGACSLPVAVVWLVFPALIACGCGGTGSTTNTLTGKVTINGKPAVAGAMVKLVSADNKVATGGVGSDGTYSVADAPEGPVKIGVIGVPTGTVKVDMPGMSAATGEPIPARYADPNSSGLTYTVKKGYQTYDIALTP